MKTTRTGTASAAQSRRVIRDGQSAATDSDAPQAARDPLREETRFAILTTSSRNTGVAPRPNMKNTNHQSICPDGRRSTFSCVGATLVSAGFLSKHEVAPMSKKTTGRKANTTAANAATTATPTKEQREAERNDEVHAHAERAGAADEPPNVPSVTFADDGAGVTISITGKAYQHLAKIAEAMNGVGWTDGENTPATIAEDWVGSILYRIGVSPDEEPNECVRDLTADIVDGIDTGAEEDDDLDRSRRDELEAALGKIDWHGENGGAA